jgi:hypothetical protein
MPLCLDNTVSYHDDGGGHGVLVKPVILLRHRRDPPTTHTHNHTQVRQGHKLEDQRGARHANARRCISKEQRCSYWDINAISYKWPSQCVCMYVPVEGGPHDGMVLDRHATELLQMGLDAAAAWNNEPMPSHRGSQEYVCSILDRRSSTTKGGTI